MRTHLGLPALTLLIAAALAGCADDPAGPARGERARSVAGGQETAPAEVSGLQAAPLALGRKAPAPLVATLAAEAPLLFNQGPGTGETHGCWANQTSWQNFSDAFSLPTGGSVAAVSIFTCMPPREGSVHVKVLSSATAGFLYEEDVVPTSWTWNGSQYEVRVALSVPFAAAPGTTYWIGVSGNGFELGQHAVRTPGDGCMSQFSGRRYQFCATVGDQMFQLFGAAGATDDTPPVVTPIVSGTMGENGWYTSDVSVSWVITDDESETSLVDGCAESLVVVDTEGVTFSCDANSEGGSTSASVTVQRDATPPSIMYGGNAGIYDVSEEVQITCTASDATSGLASSTCEEVSAEAWTLPLGINTLSADAADLAGNVASASAPFEVRVSYGGLCSLVERFVADRGIANALCQKVESAERAAQRGNLSARDGQLDAFISHVLAQRGKKVSESAADVLVQLARALKG